MTPSTVLRAPAVVTVRSGELRLPDGRAVAIQDAPLMIGRDASADVVLSDPEVSALHCELRAAPDGVHARDLGSTNGTYAGSVRVKEAVLTGRTELLVGSTRLWVEIGDKRKLDVAEVDRFGRLVGGSEKMRRIYAILQNVAPTPLGVLILGETGTGKEVVARTIHESSLRAKGPFVVVDCASIPATLAESLLFGHEKGAFTGAGERRAGALLEAHGGTLFLDELGELPQELQPKLLRVLAEREVRRLGSSKAEPIDVRVLAATRRDLNAEMNAGRFRSDLFFRIAQVRLELPPLRERIADLPQLIASTCERLGHEDDAPAVTSWIQQRLGSHDWPGNVRELVNVVSVAAALAKVPGAIDDVLTLTREAPTPADEPAGGFTEAKRQAIARFEREYFGDLVQRTSWNVSEMARQSGMERHHVRAYLRKYGLERG